MPSAATRGHGSGLVDPAYSCAKAAATPRLNAFIVEALSAGVAPDAAIQCTGWEADHCIADIEAADLVALRFDPAPDVHTSPDVSGGSAPAEAYYQACVSSLESRLPSRLGLCCCRWQPAAAMWELRSHELGLWPGDMLQLSQDLEAKRLQAAVNAEAAEKARRRKEEALAEPKAAQPSPMPAPSTPPQTKRSRAESAQEDSPLDRYRAQLQALSPQAAQEPLQVTEHTETEAEPQQPTKQETPDKSIVPGRWSSQLASSSKWVVASLRAVRVPIIVHNGLTDLLHLCDKFVGQIPKCSLELGQTLSEHFPVIFDTCVLSQDGPQDSQELTRPLPLGELQAKLAKRPDCDANVRLKEFGMYTHRASSKKLGLVFGRGVGAAARDAMCIAEAFLLEIGHQVRADLSKGSRATNKRSRTEDAEAAQSRTPKKYAKKCASAELPDAFRTVSSPGKRAKAIDFPSSPLHEVAQRDLCPSLLTNHEIYQRFRNRIATVGAPCLRLENLQPAPPKGAEFNVHSVLRDLGAKKDSKGRPIVTRAMTKQLRKVLGEFKRQQAATKGG